MVVKDDLLNLLNGETVTDVMAGNGPSGAPLCGCLSGLVALERLCAVFQAVEPGKEVGIRP